MYSAFVVAKLLTREVQGLLVGWKEADRVLFIKCTRTVRSEWKNSKFCTLDSNIYLLILRPLVVYQLLLDSCINHNDKLSSESSLICKL